MRTDMMAIAALAAMDIARPASPQVGRIVPSKAEREAIAEAKAKRDRERIAAAKAKRERKAARLRALAEKETP